MPEFTYNDRDFLMDGQPYTVLSGAMHYPRIPRAYWRDRMLKLKECGFNTVETYTFWNLHEPKEGEFHFDGICDIEAYVETAASLGLNVILRPGPYVCAEWECGGFPAWLLAYDGMHLRCNDPLYLEKVRAYFAELFRRLRPHFAGNGGNIIMCQIENEYGSFGDDKDYLRALAQMYRDFGVNCLLYTADGTCSWMLSGGTLDEYICVANFGSRVQSEFAALNAFRPGQPTMCGEFWCGWFDHWYETHHTRTAEDIAAQFTEIAEAHASVNFYMFHGGTNFGFWNGANYDKWLQPTVTSYDYCAPLTEAGDRTPAYYAIRDLVAHHFHPVPPLTAQESKKAAYGAVTLSEQALLFEQTQCLGQTIRRPAPVYMEYLGQNFGYTLYSSVVSGPIGTLPLILEGAADRALIFINGVFRGIVEPPHHSDQPELTLEKGEHARIDILVENMGRVNYGTHFADHKGLRGVRLGQRFHFGWAITPMEMDDFSALTFAPCTPISRQPVFLRGTLEIVGEPCDTFVRLDGFHKGFVVVNGFNIGRFYNDAGPQKTLYLPAPFLRAGRNEIIVFESDETSSNIITLTDTPVL